MCSKKGRVIVSNCRLALMFLVTVLASCSALSPEQGPDKASLPEQSVVLPPPSISALEIAEDGNLRIAANSAGSDAGSSAAETLQESLVDESGEVEADMAAEVGGNTLANDRYTSAIAAMRAGQDEEAETLFLEMTREFPELSGPYVNLGIIYFRAEKNSQAWSAFEKALELNPDSAISYNHLGILSRLEGDFNKALDHYTNALAIKLNYANAHLNLGILLELYLGQLKEALGHYQRYYQLTGEQDNEVKGWIIDLERRVQQN